ncbi:hypothetical protein Ae201684P_016714 [Aphanomyces euteiches]|nr:hypothetical protein Ae201684P_016714 [Aphanomyces euteiches]
MSDIEDQSQDAGDRSRSREREESDARTRAGQGRGRDWLRTPRPFMSPKRTQPPPVDAANWNPYGSFGAPKSAPTAGTPSGGAAGGAMDEDVGIEDEDMDDCADEEMKRVTPRGGKARGKENASGAESSGRCEETLKCGSNDHLVRDHPGITETEAKQLIADWHQNRRKAVNAVKAMDKESEAVTSVIYGATVEGVLALPTVLLDSGSDESLATLGLVKALRNLGVEPEFLSKTACDLKPYGAESKPLRVYRQVDEGTADCDLLIGRPAMERLGFSVDGLLVEALKQQPIWDMDDVAEPIGAMARVNQPRQLKLEQEPDGDDDETEACATPELSRVTRDDEVQEVLEQKVAEAVEQGLPPGQVDELRRILRAYQDVFRLDFGKDPPVKVAPLKVRLKEGAVPVKVGLRRYPPAHMDYLRQHVAELEAAGLIYRNNRATWAAAPRIVPKKNPGEYRMTIDSRPINAWTEAMPWPMPNLEAAMATLVGMEVFFTLDWLKGYWQLPLHPECQMWYSFMTHFGVYTPTRILMGQTDAVAFCQSVVNELFGDLMYQGVLGWLDDLLGYARSAEQLLVLLEKVLHICQEYRLKLHPKKCDFYLKEEKWCGKVISSEGISHDPSRVQGLCEMKAPTTAAELQQFLCATNWMRASIPLYAQRVDPLRRLLDVATKIAGSAKKTALAKVDLAVAGWTAEHDECFEEVKATLARMVPLAHPSEDKAICLFTDASADHWGAACTQVPKVDLELTVDKQRHESLAFLSGSFTGASSRWPVIEKEAYAVVESCKRLEYLLLRQQGFRLFTDHRNLLYIFNPRGYNSGMARYQAHKLQRWAMVMATFPYTLEHVAGEANVWGDLLSRWGAAQQRRPVLL